MVKDKRRKGEMSRGDEGCAIQQECTAGLHYKGIRHSERRIWKRRKSEAN